MSGPRMELRGSTAVVVVLLLAIELALGALLITRWIPDPEPADPSAPSIHIEMDGESVDVALVQGVVTVLVRHAPGAELFILGEDGTNVPLGSSPATWDTHDQPNGPYIIEARTDSVVASLEVSVQNARAELSTTAAVVGASTAVAAGGSAIGSSLGARAALVAAQIGKESLIAVGEDQMRMRRAGKAKRHMRSRIAFAITLLLVLLFFTFEGIDEYRLNQYLQALPVAGGVAMIFVAGALGLEYALGFASRVRTGFRFLGSGAVSLALSSVVFRTPFGIPGYVEEVGDEGKEAVESDDDEAVHVEGIRAVAAMLALLALLMPFLWIGYRWNYDIVETGMEIALIALATSALPIKPLPGYEIWRWRKLVALPFAIGAFLLYFGFQLAFLPVGVLTPMGIAGGLFYAMVWMWLRARSADVPPQWYRWMIREHGQWTRLFAAAAPASLRTISRAVERGVDRAVASAIKGAKSVVRPFVWLAARRREQQLIRDMRAANDAFAAELSDVLATFDGLDEEQMYTVVGDDVVTKRIGDFRDEAIEKVLRARFGDLRGPVTVLDPVTGAPRTYEFD